MGTWPAWASVLVASLAALVAWFSYSRTQREKREAQARLVWVSLGDLALSDFESLSMNYRQSDDELVYVEEDVRVTRWSHGEATFLDHVGFRLPIVLHNGSKELVLRWRYDLFEAHGWSDTSVKGLRFASRARNALPPERDLVISHIGVAGVWQTKGSFDVVLTFQDGSSRVWTRSHLGPIRRVPLWRTDANEDWYGNQRRRVRAVRWLLRGESPLSAGEPRLSVWACSLAFGAPQAAVLPFVGPRGDPR